MQEPDSVRREIIGSHDPSNASINNQTIPAGYRQEIDALRAIAVTAVMLSHWEPQWFKVINWGMLGVYLFFTISGYLITGILIKQESSGGIKVADFYIKRALRIWPIYFIALVILYFGWTEFDRGHILWQALFASNILSGMEGKIVFPAHFWSIAVEQQFYLLWPFVIIFFRKRLALLCVAMIVIGPLSRWYFYEFVRNIQLSAFSLTSNIDFIAAGALLALSENRAAAFSKLIIDAIGFVSIGIVMIIILSTGRLHETSLWWVDTCVAALSVWLLSWLSRNEVGRRMISNPAAMYLGKISYGIYIYHLMIGYYIADKIGARLNQLEYIGICFFTTIAVASFSWHFIERPILSFKKSG